MSTCKVGFSLGAIAKRLFAMLTGVVVLFCFSPATASASALPQSTDSLSSSLIALAASSRFAAETALGDELSLSEADLEKMKEKRREWQSQASEEATVGAEKETAGSFGEAVREKFNLNEIVEGPEADNDMM